MYISFDVCLYLYNDNGRLFENFFNGVRYDHRGCRSQCGQGDGFSDGFGDIETLGTEGNMLGWGGRTVRAGDCAAAPAAVAIAGGIRAGLAFGAAVASGILRVRVVGKMFFC